MDGARGLCGHNTTVRIDSLRSVDSASDASGGAEQTRDQLKRMAHLLDSSIRLPGGYRIGLDGLIGLLPGVGDLAGALLSTYIVAQAHRLGAPRSVILRMGLNLLTDTLVGAVPVMGDLFDFAWKANLRNVRLLEQHVARPTHTHRRSLALVMAVAITLLTAAALMVYGVFVLAHWAWTRS
jgi:hypothetical protein